MRAALVIVIVGCATTRSAWVEPVVQREVAPERPVFEPMTPEERARAERERAERERAERQRAERERAERPERAERQRAERERGARGERGPFVGAGLVRGGIGLRGEPDLQERERRVYGLEREGRHETDVAESQFWEPCVRAFVAAQAEPARRALTAALARYETTCRAGAVVLVGTHGLDGRLRRGSMIGITGTLSAQTVAVSLRVSACGGAAGAERIAIVADGMRWTSQRIAFARDEQGCDSVELPLTRALARVARAVAEATEAAVVLEASGDVAITEDTKHDLAVMLDALDALARP